MRITRQQGTYQTGLACAGWGGNNKKIAGSFHKNLFNVVPE
jgi:hypothetical protein